MPSEPKRRSESTVLGPRILAAISAVEGLELTPAGRKRVHSSAPIERRRVEVLRAYTISKDFHGDLAAIRDDLAALGR